MSLPRQAMQTAIRRIGPRSIHPLYHLRVFSLNRGAAARYGPQQLMARPERSEGAGPVISVSGSESDSDTDSSFPLLEAEAEAEPEGSPKALGPLAGLGSIMGIALLLGAGVLLKDVIRDFLVFFMDAVDSWGPLGYLAYAAVYTGLEVLAVPAIPLTMTAGVIFGPVAGTLITSLSGTLAATIAFLIARYAARDRVLRWARRNKKFAAIDKAIARDGFKFVTLLRLSPLFPLAASNYLYGLTSVDLWSYVAGSWIGMLPGTYAYVSAGHLGKAALMDGEGSVGVESWQVALGLGVTLLAIGYVGRLAKTAIEEAEAGSGNEDTEGSQKASTSSSPSSPSSSSTSSLYDATNGGSASTTVSNGISKSKSDSNSVSSNGMFQVSVSITNNSSRGSGAGESAKAG
ncbi:hypothetical protein VOLCADRAFT_121223 [Volvox carteri f. nagariensis]|uniref:VTT domain-containing protein n=1 Tax=Volvox carteri f. nagariensis TaxID=3068 RepID=D8U5F5_VOLCA|nr:uncharacterized protein VOLCADRAFT_121223 [Volvox carteri f. nagariensis]EFJ44910.1 hypothetical protein VOLCADRAFT_121223 [Volvox carteri f. nagariensis]|eukprot:XP_002953881.1 hypothetical protein VOLCADRAFT_121223 [Volvox carteri f. nagariensis]